MSALKYIACFLFLALTLRIYSQDHSIYIFDPNGVSSSFQYTLLQLTEDSVFVADSLDDSIYYYDAAFLFIEFPYVLSEINVDRLKNYTAEGKPTYLVSDPAIDSTNQTFWSHIGLDEMLYLLVSSFVDSVTGIDTTFIQGIVIDTSFMSSGIPSPIGTISPILTGQSAGLDIHPTYISTIDTLIVILDLYNLIDDEGYLRRVLEYFDLIPQQQNVQIQFFPQVDTAWIFGGCTGPDFVTHNLVSTLVRDSITIEPGPSSYFFYYDSLGNTILVDKYYFIVEDSVNQYEYELWFHPKSWPPFDPVIIQFDSIFYFQQNSFDIQLLVKHNNTPIDSLSQFFRADWGLSVEDGSKEPETFYLSQNYPNPFNPSTVISYQLPVTSNVTLKVYDVLGNEIATLVNEEKQPDTYEVDFKASSDIRELVSGIYFYQLRAGSFIETKKMVLMK